MTAITKKFVAPKIQPEIVHIDVPWWQRFYKWRTTRRQWRLLEDWIFWSNKLQTFVKIPKGLVFDGASVPKIFHSIINSTDGVFFGALPHDFIYRFAQLLVCPENVRGECDGLWVIHQDVSRSTADSMLYDLPNQIEGRKIPNGIAYGIIRPFGGMAWKKNRVRGWKLKTAYPSPDNGYLTAGSGNFEGI